MAVTMTVAEIEDAKEIDLGSSSWVTLGQPRIDKFAEATGDYQWIHLDQDRATRGPFGTTIAHGYLTLSLIPELLDEVLELSDRRMGLNYGIDRLRFISPVPSGSRIRLRARLLSGERRGEGILYRISAEVEIEGYGRPALAGEILYVAYT